MANTTGKAYAFFDCDASKKEIEDSEQDIRSEARTPQGLQMLLYEGISSLKLDETLVQQLEYPDDYRVISRQRSKSEQGKESRPLSSMKYALVASYDGATNETTANELGDIVNTIHRQFNKDQGLFRGAIVYEDAGEYILRE